MCLTFFYIGEPGISNSNDELKYVQIFNREESLHRATEPLHFFEDDKNIIGSKDKVADGTWLGINIK